MNIVIIGTGNTASVLGKKFLQAGHRIVQVFGRSKAAAATLSQQLNATCATKWNQLSLHADLYVIAVSDAAVQAVAEKLSVTAAIVVHTAAAVKKDVLKKAAEHYGVFYPFQTLRKEQERLPEIPIFIDASDNYTLQQLTGLAESISSRVAVANDEKREQFHLAAVFVNNFVNHIYALTAAYCREHGLDFSLLQPLIQETALKIADVPPQQVQTGPAVRGDQPTIASHLALLQNHPNLYQFYNLFTSSISHLHKQQEP